VKPSCTPTVPQCTLLSRLSLFTPSTLYRKRAQREPWAAQARWMEGREQRAECPGTGVGAVPRAGTGAETGKSSETRGRGAATRGGAGRQATRDGTRAGHKSAGCPAASKSALPAAAAGASWLSCRWAERVVGGCRRGAPGSRVSVPAAVSREILLRRPGEPMGERGWAGTPDPRFLDPGPRDGTRPLTACVAVVSSRAALSSPPHVG